VNLETVPPGRTESRTGTVLLVLSVLDAIYVLLRIVLSATIPLAGVLAAVVLLIAMVVVRLKHRQTR
jgi:hypothetical protein